MKKLELKEVNDRLELFIDGQELNYKIGWKSDFPEGLKPQFGFSLKIEMFNALRAELDSYYASRFTQEEIDAILAFIKCNLSES